MNDKHLKRTIDYVLTAIKTASNNDCPYNNLNNTIN